MARREGRRKRGLFYHKNFAGLHIVNNLIGSIHYLLISVQLIFEDNVICVIPRKSGGFIYYFS